MADDTELGQYAQELFQNVCAEAEAGEYKESVFFRMVTDDLIDAGEFDDAVYVNYQPANNVRVRVDGYCGDPMDSAVEEDEPLTLGLIISEFVQEPDVVTLTQREMGAAFNKLLTFVNNALKPDWRSALEHTSSEYELADLIATRWSRIIKIRLYLITNKKLSSRVDGKHAIAFQNRQVAYSVWDLRRLLALSHSTKEREVLRVDFTQDGLHPLRALLASSPDSPNPVYLAVMPGEDLARIYDRWGARLLEQNVRVFLQARSKVNKGIKGTLEHEPELFFSFNNGLTTTAEAVRISEDGNYILSMDNLQIVNGGQTTASIYAAYRAGCDLSKVFVQMKLNVIQPSDVEELVPQISRFANTQNKVSEADLFSNHPFHTRIQALSQRLLAPAKEGTFIQTKWFYERARGQYGDAQAYLTPGEKKKFLLQYPKNQKFTKTDLAKYLRVWEDDAYRVNLGAQKNFVEYAKVLTDRWAEDNTQFNEYFFHSLIAKKIVFNTAESLIPQRPWYEAGGYRAPLVVLSIGLIGNSVRNMGKRVDFERIWNEQQLDEPWREAICQAADAVNPVLMNPAQGYRNISEWAKKQRCWDKVRSLHVDWNDAWLSELISPDAERSRERESGRVQRDDNEIENQRVVVNQKPEFWEKVEKWLVTEGEGTEKERGCVHVAASMPSKIPTEKQCAVIVGLMHRIENEGCPFHMVMTL
ncbi:AIPR family protein [Bifidobacterium thermophilum]|nr:AIPR family protein [Bifidobacterium thermophilum]